MKIAYFTDSFLPAINGVITSILNTSVGLIERNHDVTIYAPSSKINTRMVPKKLKIELIPSVRSTWYPQLRMALPISPNMLLNMQRNRPDILHFHSPFLLGSGSIALSKLFKIPIVGSFHTYFMEPEYLKIIGLDNVPVLKAFLWKYTVTFYNQCDVVIVPTTDCISTLRKKGVDKPIVCISNAINESAIKRISTDKINKLRDTLSLKSRVLLYVGRLSPEKNVDILIKSMQEVFQKDDDVSLLIIGSGPEEARLKNLVSQIGLQQNVCFTGVLSQNQLLCKGYYQVADIFVTASTSETQGITVIEAMYFGLPIIAANKRGSREMVRDVGLLAKSNDSADFASKIMMLLGDTKLAEQLKNRSEKQYRSHFDYVKTITSFESLYTSLLDRYRS